MSSRRASKKRRQAEDLPKCAEAVLAHLNLSSGTPDVRLLDNLNQLFASLATLPDGEGASGEDAPPTWRRLHALLTDELQRRKEADSPAFADTEQVEAVLRLGFEELLGEYRRWHADLLAPWSDEQLFRPMFLGRACEAVIRQGGPWSETTRVVRGALHELNDYLGYRPVAVLETEQRIQPYDHEWVAPIPLYVRGAGVAVGPYAELIGAALKIIEQAPPSILFQAYFDIERLEELALDPRAYDFDHPVNKRPNYLYGQWDLSHLDNAGYARRFVLHRVALEAILDRVSQAPKGQRDEYLVEAAAVLAGTMLMGSGVSANRAGAHDSSATLGTLVQPIAAYRDAFYQSLLEQIDAEHADRLHAEAEQLHQPFGGARQHFNHYVAQARAQQLQNVHLAMLYARMGHTEAAEAQARGVPVTSARLHTDIHSRLQRAHRALDGNRPADAAALAEEIEALIHRGIQCGALLDPWNILGFSARFSLFPALENSVHDYRADDLISILGSLFDLLVRIRKTAAAGGEKSLDRDIARRMNELATWWDRFATMEVPDVDSFSGRETCESAEHVATALRDWHEAGTSAGDLAFWRDRVEQFRTAKAYALVVEALLEQGDPTAAMALLVQWLARTEEAALYGDGYSFHELAVGWMEGVLPPRGDTPHPAHEPIDMPDEQRWPLARKLLDFIEANADEYWEVPRFEFGEVINGYEDLSDEELEQLDEMGAEEDYADDEDDEDDGLFSAAYENVVFRGSTDDGMEGDLHDEGQYDPVDSELAYELDRISDRLAFIGTLARLWKLAAVFPENRLADGGEGREESLQQWLTRAGENRRALTRLMRAVHRHEIPPPRSTQQSLAEYERRLSMKESLLEQIVLACLEMIDAERMLRVALDGPPPAEMGGDWRAPAEAVLRALLVGDRQGVEKQWTSLLRRLRREPLLFVALPRGGDPRGVVNSRTIQIVLRRILRLLPRLGLIGHAGKLIGTIQRMEAEHPVGPGAITEFDDAFETGFRTIVRCLVQSSENWQLEGAPREDGPLIALLERLTDRMLRHWLLYSRGLRLSPVEKLLAENRWKATRRFIETYGADLFTQSFLMNAGNLRAILHEGVGSYLDALADEPGAEEEIRLVADLQNGRIDPTEAIGHLETIIESILEHYPEYVDYNNTTTQSDKGEKLYMLLDFLRLLVSYDRVALNLRPVLLVHDELVRGGRLDAAEAWQQAIAAQAEDVADQHLRRFERLVRRYGMRLRSIAERIAERFTQPLVIDRLRALVGPAMSDDANVPREEAFAELCRQIKPLAENLAGAGIEVPAWLEALQAEVEQVEAGVEGDDLLEPHLNIPQRKLDWESAVAQVDGLD